MTIDSNNPAIDDEDLNTTAPNPPIEWEMPEPVFRKTSGRLPQGFEKELANARAEHAASLDEGASAPDEPVKLEEHNAALTEKTSAVKLVLVLLAIVAMIAFLIIFVSLVYFFLLR